MRKSHRLPTVLRVFFNVSYGLGLILTALLVVILALRTALPEREGRRGFGIPLIHDVPLSLTDQTKPLTAHLAASSDRDIKITRLTARVSIGTSSRDPELGPMALWAILTPAAVVWIGALLCCRLLRDLCALFERGEVFTDGTLRLVRNLGLLYVLTGVAEIISNLCFQHFLAGYFARSATLSGMGASFDASLVDAASLGGNIVNGLLILCLAEAFRQGLALKQEAALTV